MGIINQLDIQVANLIAAGEVVDRPAGACKELLENAIDADATVVTVEIKNGGSSFIRVTDNGKGMAREDVPVAILRHATSKIKTAADLSDIMTFGFRGEALAAIASVSHIRIMTKRREDSVGTLLDCQPGEKPVLSDIAMSDGTTVIVEDLFRNVPARRKFLKKDQTEAMAVTAAMEKIALSNPKVSVRFLIDGTMRFSTIGDGILKNTIYSILGRDYTAKLIELVSGDSHISVSGFIGTPENVRANRNFQIFFVNGRYIKSKCAQAALEEAFTSYCPAEKFPTCVMEISLPANEVDVNVHPAKLEVKFANEKDVFEQIYYTVRGALENAIPRPKLSVFGDDSSSLQAINAFVPIHERGENRNPNKNSAYPNIRQAQAGQMSIRDAESENTDSVDLDSLIQNAVGLRSYRKDGQIPAIGSTPTGNPSDSAVTDEAKPTLPREEFPSDTAEMIPPSLRQTEPPLSENPQQAVQEQTDTQPSASENAEPITDTEHTVPRIGFVKKPPEYRILGEAFYSYIFVEVGDSVLIIDKHAAHERILFEQMRANIANEDVQTQMLMPSVRISTSSVEYQTAMEYREDIAALGFCMEFANNCTVALTGIPIAVELNQATDMFVDLIGRLSACTITPTLARQQYFEKALYQASCKAAIKIGHNEDIEHIRYIVDKLLSLDDIKYCPHGRPVAFELSRHTIEHQFKRI